MKIQMFFATLGPVAQAKMMEQAKELEFKRGDFVYRMGDQPKGIYLKDLHPERNWTRQEIANFCSSTVSTVIKTLAEREDKKLIRQAGRVIEVLDRTALVNL
jgi:CRP-like cAMP-binding protein